MENRPKTKSKHFYDDEIICILEDGSIYLKEGVHRFYSPALNQDAYQNINYQEKAQAKIEKAMKQVEEEKNFN